MDASVASRADCLGFGYIVRNKQGKIVVAQAIPYKLLYDPSTVKHLDFRETLITGLTVEIVVKAIYMIETKIFLILV